jgi:esterase/lipase superfamily enzyme
MSVCDRIRGARRARRARALLASLALVVSLGVGCAKQSPSVDRAAASSRSTAAALDEATPGQLATPRPATALPLQTQSNVGSGLNWSGPGRSEAPALDAQVSASGLPKPSASSTSPIPPQTAANAPAAPAEPLAKELDELSELGNLIEVFYATDRLPTAALLPSTWRTFAPVIVVWMIGGALCIGFSMARRFNALWLVGCGLAVCLGMTVLHASIIRWQQYSRLARNAETRFSADRDSSTGDYPLHLGTARVTLPSTHRPGRFEQPKLYRFEFIESADKHIVLHSLQEQASAAAWFEQLSELARSSDRNETFVFIHGYNVRFIDALKRTAQLSHDLELQGPAICYSWPSRGDVVAYTADEASVSWSAPHFEQLLLDLRGRTGCQRVNVIAHSMGNRALLEAIERIDAQKLGQPKLIDSLVMAAPDVDLGEFSSRYLKPLQNVAQHTTLYFSDSDRALLLSARLHGAPRLGLLRDHLQAFAGIESVYVGAQASLSLGHSYYGDDSAVIEDLKSLLQDGRAAASRELLRSATTSAGVAFWHLERSLHAQRSGGPGAMVK